MQQRHRVTLADIATRADVSLSTVSRALSNSSRVNQRTRERILQIASELQFDGTPSARQQVVTLSRTIGVVVEDIANPYFSNLAKKIESTLQEHGYAMLLTDSDYNETKEVALTRLLLRQGVLGVLITAVSPDSTAVALLKEHRAPFMMLNCQTDDSDVDWICSDNVTGGYLATSYLLELGHPRVLLLRGNNSKPARDRYEGFRRAVLERGMKLEDQVVVGFASNQQDGYRTITELIERRGRAAVPTAIFAANDPSAIGVLEALQDKGIEVPENVSVIGYDNIDIASFLKVPLTTVDQSENYMGEIAASQLIDKIERKEHAAVRRILIKPTIKVRSSTAAFAATRPVRG